MIDSPTHSEILHQRHDKDANMFISYGLVASSIARTWPWQTNVKDTPTHGIASYSRYDAGHTKCMGVKNRGCLGMVQVPTKIKDQVKKNSEPLRTQHGHLNGSHTHPSPQYNQRRVED